MGAPHRIALVPEVSFCGDQETFKLFAEHRGAHRGQSCFSVALVVCVSSDRETVASPFDFAMFRC